MSERKAGDLVEVDGYEMWVVSNKGDRLVLTDDEPCQHSITHHKIERNCYPYGADMKTTYCTKCGDVVKCESI
jgi:hypothetical protein